MSDPYTGEIRPWAPNFAPVGWAFCNGALMSIAQYDALFQLIGTTYGGDGQNTFALPDLRGRIPIHQGNGFVIGQVAGEESVTLIANQVPAHTHTVNAQSAVGTSASPSSGFWAASDLDAFTSASSDSALNPNAIAPAGSSTPHNNMMPFLSLNFIICLNGIFPSQ
jgi:microcystin-dependent protein